jgi:phosphate transport system substrate-binding protein
MNLSRKLMALCLLTGSLVAIPCRSFSQAKPITIKGSDTMVLLGQRWAEAYMKKYPSVQVQVTGGGSGVGIAALINGSTDICESSRPMKEKEKADLRAKRGMPAVEVPVAVDGLAIYVNTANALKSLTLDQARQVYIGKIKDWQELGGKPGKIIVYGRENSSGTYAYFKEHVLANADFHPSVQTLPGTAAVTNAVSKDLKAIGYGGIAYGKGIKHLQIKKDDASPAVEPNMANVLSGQYPISRNLFWYFSGEPSGELLKITNWVLSAEGQKLVEEVGYYPLPKKSSAPAKVPTKKAVK